MVAFHIATIFPELFDAFTRTSLIGKAIQKGLVYIDTINPRNFARDRHSSVDDAPYGGGAGMVMRPGPILDLLDAIRSDHAILLSPQGQPFCQASAQRLTNYTSILLFCGRYEGVDDRVRSRFDEEISIGDFVLCGGEVAAMAIVETLVRLIPGVLGNPSSTVEESFSDGALEYPHYTRPETIQGLSVPSVLLSGDHARIARWRRRQSLLRTMQRRPDLFQKLELNDEDRQLLTELEDDNDGPHNP
ncbi:MAG: tRNA (guanosine(37)-N1)-methyltransferase TrmD [Myxococcota bacterium]|nr:tRNA (guanosine(37)-N1)-methyltransferase TrmD [Myxococcota bacterium]